VCVVASRKRTVVFVLLRHFVHFIGDARVCMRAGVASFRLRRQRVRVVPLPRPVVLVLVTVATRRCILTTAAAAAATATAAAAVDDAWRPLRLFELDVRSILRDKVCGVCECCIPRSVSTTTRMTQRRRERQRNDADPRDAQSQEAYNACVCVRVWYREADMQNNARHD
jgi:hypothetical protein